MSLDKTQTLLHDQKRRMTKQRKAILTVLRDTDSHPDAYWIHQAVRRQLPNISLGTIYRSLKVLCDLGLVRELNYGDQHSRYDGNVSPHGHVTCLRCGRISDISIPKNDDFRRLAEEESGYRIQTLRFEFEGLCPDCKLSS